MEKDKSRSAGIRVEGSDDVEIGDNRIEGFDDGIIAKASKRVSVQGNDISAPEPSDRLGWIRTHLMSLLVALLAGLAVAYAAFRFGWV